MREERSTGKNEGRFESVVCTVLCSDMLSYLISFADVDDALKRKTLSEKKENWHIKYVCAIWFKTLIQRAFSNSVVWYNEHEKFWRSWVTSKWKLSLNSLLFLQLFLCFRKFHDLLCNVCICDWGLHVQVGFSVYLSAFEVSREFRSKILSFPLSTMSCSTGAASDYMSGKVLSVLLLFLLPFPFSILQTSWI